MLSKQDIKIIVKDEIGDHDILRTGKSKPGKISLNILMNEGSLCASKERETCVGRRELLILIFRNELICKITMIAGQVVYQNFDVDGVGKLYLEMLKKDLETKDECEAIRSLVKNIMMHF